MAKDAFGGEYEANVLTSGPYPNQSFVGVMTVAQRDASKANIGAMIYQTDGGAGLYVYVSEALGWVQV
jgi:hypothetical protein